jgi:hypothetical protein
MVKKSEKQSKYEKIVSFFTKSQTSKNQKPKMKNKPNIEIITYVLDILFQ